MLHNNSVINNLSYKTVNWQHIPSTGSTNHRVHTPFEIIEFKAFKVFQGYFMEEFKAILSDKKHKNYC